MRLSSGLQSISSRWLAFFKILIYFEVSLNILSSEFCLSVIKNQYPLSCVTWTFVIKMLLTNMSLCNAMPSICHLSRDIVKNWYLNLFFNENKISQRKQNINISICRVSMSMWLYTESSPSTFLLVFFSYDLSSGCAGYSERYWGSWSWPFHFTFLQLFLWKLPSCQRKISC